MTENIRSPIVRQGHITTIIMSVQFVTIATIGKQFLRTIKIQVTFLSALFVAYIILPRIQPVNQGFICEDPSLRYEYHENTIEIYVVHLMGYFFLIATIFLVECQPLNGLISSKLCQNDDNSLNERLISGLYAFFASQIGLVMNFLLYNLVKYSCKFLLSLKF